MHSTRVTMGRGSVSTHHGQQRILKHSTPDLVTYIQKAVQTGIYRSNEEIEEMNKHLQEDPTDIKRIRWHVPRGSKIHDYPAEYEILSLNPPAPFKPFMPVKYIRKSINKYTKENRPTDRLARNYLNKQHRRSKASGEPATAEEYYRRLLGSNKAPKIDSAMGSKSAILNKAYAVAVKQYHLMRTENLSEKDALDKVEELLKQEDFKEKQTSREKAQNFAQHDLSNLDADNRAKTVFPEANPSFRPKKKRNHRDAEDDTELVNLYSDNQRAFEGMISWTHRLQAVPYRQWTVGASTALDHWIAKRVLGMSEETWLELLEGDTPHLLGRGRDIVMARHALFPETLLDEDEASLSYGEDDSNVDNVDDDLDALLATLGGWNTEEDKKADSSTAENDKILDLTVQLQDWRAKQMTAPFEDWSQTDQQDFSTWLEDYVSTLTPESNLGKVDMNATRKALLASPPQSKEESDLFWDKICDETAAEIFLQQLLSEKKDSSSHPFWELDYSQQLERLVNLGAIRDIADEYAKESDRGKFMARYGDYLLEGLELDHLVANPAGSIRGSDLGEELMKTYNISPNDRFHLESIPYGTDEFGTEASHRARDIYRAWNKFKAGRAHYEEKLFQKGMLGLSYTNEKANKTK